MSEALEMQIDEVPDDSDTLVIRVSRELTAGTPLYASNPEEAAGHPLARRLMELKTLEAVLLQGHALTLLKNASGGPWEPIVAAARNYIEEHFQEVDRAAAEHDRELTPEERDLALGVQELLNAEVNPAVASHGGFIEVLGVRADTVYIHMSGGCQGCGMATQTLKQGVETAIRRRFPAIRNILDTTDHAAGLNPYYAAR